MLDTVAMGPSVRPPIILVLLILVFLMAKAVDLVTWIRRELALREFKRSLKEDDINSGLRL